MLLNKLFFVCVESALSMRLAVFFSSIMRACGACLHAVRAVKRARMNFADSTELDFYDSSGDRGRSCTTASMRDAALELRVTPPLRACNLFLFLRLLFRLLRALLGTRHALVLVV